MNPLLVVFFALVSVLTAPVVAMAVWPFAAATIVGVRHALAGAFRDLSIGICREFRHRLAVIREKRCSRKGLYWMAGGSGIWIWGVIVGELLARRLTALEPGWLITRESALPASARGTLVSIVHVVLVVMSSWMAEFLRDAIGRGVDDAGPE